MPRPKTFDVDEALDRAVDVFWTRGYEATSLCDLVEHMGIGRQSLYDTFGDKHALFLRVLDRFRDEIGCTPLSCLEAPGAGGAEIRAFFDGLTRNLTASEPRRACLLMTSAMERAPHDPEVARRVRRYLKRLESAFRNALAGAVERGELAPDPPPADRALALANCVAGLSVMARAGASRAACRRVVDVTLDGL